jgi:CheY-like chemotaxis protein
MKTPTAVLMVEDNRGDVVLMQEAIKNAGLPYHLTLVPDGVEALEFLRQQGKYAGAARPELIILDLKLPRKTGIEVLVEIELDPALRGIPIVVLSSSTSELAIARARRVPPYTCMVKPGTFDGYIELARTIEAFRNTEPKDGVL